MPWFWPKLVRLLLQIRASPMNPKLCLSLIFETVEQSFRCVGGARSHHEVFGRLQNEPESSVAFDKKIPRSLQSPTRIEEVFRRLKEEDSRGSTRTTLDLWISSTEEISFEPFLNRSLRRRESFHPSTWNVVSTCHYMLRWAKFQVWGRKIF